MMKLLLSVRPRMKASGAISITCFSSSRVTAFEIEHVVQRVVQRAQVRIDLGHQVAGQESEPLPRFDRRAGEDDALHLLRLQRADRHRHREPRLPGPGGTDPERDHVVRDRIDVALLPTGLRLDLSALGALQDVVAEDSQRGSRRPAAS